MAINIQLLNKSDLDGISNVTYSESFFYLQKKRYNLDSGFLNIYSNDGHLLFFPVNYSKKEIFSVYKDYTIPLFIRKEYLHLDWKEIANEIRKQFNAEYLEFNFTFLDKTDAYHGFKISPLSCCILKLSGTETRASIFKKFHKKTRNEIRKAEKSDLEIKIGGKENLSEIYELYLENMARHRTPPKSIDVFNDLFACYGDNCKAIMAYGAYAKNNKAGKNPANKSNDKILAGVNLVLTHNNYLRLLFNFSKREYWRDCVNNLLYSKMIEWGYKNGIRIFDFGANLTNDKTHGHFKLGFGAEQIPIMNLTIGSKKAIFKKWLERKKLSLRIRINKFRVYGHHTPKSYSITSKNCD